MGRVAKTAQQLLVFYGGEIVVDAGGLAGNELGDPLIRLMCIFRSTLTA